MRRWFLTAASAAAVLTGGAVALAHDADSSETGVQPHQVGPYQVLDDVTHAFTSETTTGSYTVTVPAKAQKVDYVSLRLPSCTSQQRIDAISSGGELLPNGDSSTGTPGPAIKWEASQKAGETKTYFYRIKGLAAPDESEIVLRSGASSRGTIERISCNRLDGGCTFEMSAANDSTEVSAVFPPGRAGLRVGFEGSCPPGGETEQDVLFRITADGVAVSMLKQRFFSGSGGARQFTSDLHLPVAGAHEVCIEAHGGDPNAPIEKVCVRPPI